MLYDFHTHIDMYDDPRPIVDSINKNCIKSISASVDIDSYLATLKIAKQSSLIIPSFGIHPSRACHYSDRLSDLDKYIDESTIIGEIGLDYLWAEPLDKNAQIKVFTYIADKCVQQDKYMVIHTKNAETDILEILDSLHTEKVIIHWYSGPQDILNKYIERGWYFTYGVELSSSSYIRSLLKITPIEKVLPETDNPVGIEWLTGRTGMPEDINIVYSQISEITGLPANEIMETLEKNCLKILSE